MLATQASDAYVGQHRRAESSEVVSVVESQGVWLCPEHREGTPVGMKQEVLFSWCPHTGGQDLKSLLSFSCPHSGIINPIEAKQRKGKGAVGAYGSERTTQSLQDFPVADSEEEAEEVKMTSVWAAQDLDHFTQLLRAVWPLRVLTPTYAAGPAGTHLSPDAITVSWT